MEQIRSHEGRRRLIAALVSMLAASGGFGVWTHPAAAATGPDVTVYDLSGTTNYGVGSGYRGYSIGTVSCNVGTAPLNWCDDGGGCGLGTTDEDHPVIAQNVYRLKDGRFEQIGMSWLKHGFTSLNQSAGGCGDGSCDSPPLGGNQLGVGCTDPYGSGLNGSRPLGKRSEVNATTGDFPFPFGGGGSTAQPADQRVKVLEAELDPTLNPGARYFLEGQYVAPDDASLGNGLNNASYREVSVSMPSFNLSMVGGTVRQKSAIEVWETIDPAVEFLNVDSKGSIVERYHVARKVTNPSPGVWHYEYAIHNLNSDRSAYSFAIEFPSAVTITNVGYRDVDHHSGEPYAATDWVPTVGANGVTWATEDFATNANANALRWGTMFSFWFDADAFTFAIDHTLGLFKAGAPSTLTFSWTADVFADGFETGDTSAWTDTIEKSVPK